MLDLGTRLADVSQVILKYICNPSLNNVLGVPKKCTDLDGSSDVNSASIDG